MSTSQETLQYQAAVFLRTNAHLAYDDALSARFWQQCTAQSLQKTQTKEGTHYVFQDGSVLSSDGMGALTTSPTTSSAILSAIQQTLIKDKLQEYRKENPTLLQTVKQKIQSIF